MLTGQVVIMPVQDHTSSNARATFLQSHLAGLTVVLLLACGATGLTNLNMMVQNNISPLTLGILAGMLAGNLTNKSGHHRIDIGVEFAKSRLLKAGIVLFGCHFTFSEVTGLGWTGLLIDLAVMAGVLILTFVVGRLLLRLDAQTSLLIGAGSAICGAAAILATASVIKAKADNVVVAVATVVIFGTISMFVYPFIGTTLALTDYAYGIYAGSTIHEVAQVVAAASVVSPDAAQVAVLEKMIRVMLLAPFLILLALLPSHAQAAESHRLAVTHLPWFAIVFLLVIGINTVFQPGVMITAPLLALDNLLLTMAMVALGLKTRISIIRQAGIKPLLLGAVLFVFLVGGGALINQLLR